MSFDVNYCILVAKLKISIEKLNLLSQFILEFSCCINSHFFPRDRV